MRVQPACVPAKMAPVARGHESEPAGRVTAGDGADAATRRAKRTLAGETEAPPVEPRTSDVATSVALTLAGGACLDTPPAPRSCATLTSPARTPTEHSTEPSWEATEGRDAAMGERTTGEDRLTPVMA